MHVHEVTASTSPSATGAVMPAAVPAAAVFARALASASGPDLTLGQMVAVQGGVTAATASVPASASATLGAIAGGVVGGMAGASVAGGHDHPTTDGLVMPVAGRVGSGYGNRVHPITGEHRLHAGVDIAAPEGTPIVAAADGVVTFAGRRGGYGLLVEVEHADGSTTRYAHQSRIAVSVGDRVTAGARLGDVGSTGMSTGPHLHFELRVDGSPVDPEPHLGAHA